jgi:hypothetical protein
MQSTLYPRLLFMTATSLHPIYRTSGFTRLRAEPQDAQFTVAAPQHFLYFFPKPQGHGSFRPTLGAVGIRHPSFLSSSRLPVPINRPAIPLAIRKQDKVQQDVDELRSGDIPILSQASPDL